MIGAIASFVFKTAGEAVGFLAKHAWLLILAAVTIMIEKFKRNKMKFITVKSKQTTVSVDLVPPLVLGDKQRVSLVDIRIPEQNNARRLQQVIEYKSQGEAINFEISITDKGAYLAAQENEVLFFRGISQKI